MMQLDEKNFYRTIESFTHFTGQLTELSAECFLKAYGSNEAKKEKGIVYVLRSEKSFGRLKGESNILYIGQTKHSFGKRYAPYAELHVTSKANKYKFGHILENLGPITISVHGFEKFGKTLLEAEGQLLWWYFLNHCELNR